MGEESSGRSNTPAVEQKPPESALDEEKPIEEKEPERAVAPDDPTLYLTVPRLGLYGHTARNGRSEEALGLGTIKLPSTGFPWQKGDTDTYIACHRLGFLATESFRAGRREGRALFADLHRGSGRLLHLKWAAVL